MGGKRGPGGGDDADQSGVRGPPPPFSFPAFPSPAPPSPHLSAGKPPLLRLVGKWWTLVTVSVFFVYQSVWAGLKGPLRETVSWKAFENHVPGLGKTDLESSGLNAGPSIQAPSLQCLIVCLSVCL